MTEPKAPQDSQKSVGSRSKLSIFLSHPTVAAINLIAAIIGVIGLPLSFYFYHAAKEYPLLTYYISPAKAVVVKAGQASKLTALYDNKVITTDITAAQIVLWNGGSRSIKGTDVLQPVVIHVGSDTPILEASVRKISREVIQLKLNTEELDKGRVSVSWNILEPNDGGIVQLIYAGDPEVNVDVSGIIEGSRKL